MKRYYTLRIRVQGTSFEEVHSMTEKLREGKNPKYEGRQMWASYSSHRVKNGRELPITL